jgi:pyrophosphatase PpaX
VTAISTYLFDLDGTLIDSIRLILDSYHHTLAVHGLPPKPDAAWLKGLGTPLRVQFREWIEDAETMERLVATYREYNLANHDRMVRGYGGITEVVRELRARGRGLGVVTSKTRDGTLRGLRRVGLEDCFEVLVCAEDVTNPKPHGEPVERALRLLGVEPEGTVYVGDSVHDMRSGRAAGVKTAGALWGPFGRGDLQPAEPDYWLEQPSELLRLLEAP